MTSEVRPHEPTTLDRANDIAFARAAALLSRSDDHVRCCGTPVVLPGDTVVHTGHGESTTIGAEAPHLDEWIARGH